MLSVIMLSVVMLSIIMLNVFMLRVVTPNQQIKQGLIFINLPFVVGGVMLIPSEKLKSELY